MSSSTQRLKNIKHSIEDIEYILNMVDFKITQAVEDSIIEDVLRIDLPIIKKIADTELQ
jgi:hypothetical protein